MNTTIQKWGNSLAVRLPKEVVRKRSLHEGSAVKIQTDKERIIITTVSKQASKVELATLLRDIKADNLHKEQSWGEPQGNEVW